MAKCTLAKPINKLKTANAQDMAGVLAAVLRWAGSLTSRRTVRGIYVAVPIWNTFCKEPQTLSDADTLN